MFVEKEVVEKLTGSPRRSRQVKFLRRRRYKFEINDKGEVLIHQKYLDERLGVLHHNEPTDDINEAGLRELMKAEQHGATQKIT